MKEKVEKLMNLLEINIVRFINEEEEMCSFVTNSMVQHSDIECILEKYYLSIFPSALGDGIIISLLVK